MTEQSEAPKMRKDGQINLVKDALSRAKLRQRMRHGKCLKCDEAPIKNARGELLPVCQLHYNQAQFLGLCIKCYSFPYRTKTVRYCVSFHKIYERERRRKQTYG